MPFFMAKLQKTESNGYVNHTALYVSEIIDFQTSAPLCNSKHKCRCYLDLICQHSSETTTIGPGSTTTTLDPNFSLEPTEPDGGLSEGILLKEDSGELVEIVGGNHGENDKHHFIDDLEITKKARANKVKVRTSLTDLN